MILITGSKGYIGSHLKLENFIPYNLKDGNSINDIENLRKIFKENKITTVIHLAALKSNADSFKYEKEYYSTNVEGTKNIIQVMKEFNCNKIIFASSATVYGITTKPSSVTDELAPISPYGKSKMYAEQEILKSGLDYVILRIFNPIGGEDSTKWNIYAALKSKFVEIYGDGSEVRDYIDINDVARAIEKSLDLKNVILNIGTGVGTTTLELVKKYNCEYTFKEPRVGDVPYSVASLHFTK